MSVTRGEGGGCGSTWLFQNELWLDTTRRHALGTGGCIPNCCNDRATNRGRGGAACWRATFLEPLAGSPNPGWSGPPGCCSGFAPPAPAGRRPSAPARGRAWTERRSPAEESATKIFLLSSIKTCWLLHHSRLHFIFLCPVFSFSFLSIIILKKSADMTELFIQNGMWGMKINIWATNPRNYTQA